jgi:beta-carotene hydroxylase
MSNSVDAKALEKQARQAAMTRTGAVAWPTVGLAVGIIAAYGATFAGVMTDRLSFGAGFIIISLLIYAIYTVLHETVHGNVSGADHRMKWLNDGLGYIAGHLMGISYKMHRAEHFGHHRATNDPEKDPDVVFAGGGFLDVLIGSFKVIPVQYSYYFKNVWPRASASDRAIAFVEVAAIVGSRVGLAVAGYPLEALILGVLPSISGNLITVTFFAWIVHFPHTEQDRYVNTTTYVFPGWIGKAITYLWLYQNYHSIHHLFPRVPFFKYKEVFEEIRGPMEAMGAPIYEWGEGLKRPSPELA